jgi:hypothetical protein
MVTPTSATRPRMPAYGVPGPGEDDRGLLPWPWAEERLVGARNYWLITVRADGTPHPMPIWGLWLRTGFFFNTSGKSGKARNLAGDRRAVLHTEDGTEPVVVEGTAVMVSDPEVIDSVLDAYREKYGWAPTDLDGNPIFHLRPSSAFGIIERGEEFSSSATRWLFAGDQ